MVQFFPSTVAMTLPEIIAERIERNGAISFYDYMEMCLYYPQLGYYTSDSDKIGKDGDFYTSCLLTPFFGAMIGRQLEEMWGLLGEKDFTILEFGAGTGILSQDILRYIEEKAPVMYQHLTYSIIEKSPAMCIKEQALLGNKVKWYNSISEIPRFTGCILSNELVDNFSVHQVVMQHELMEVFVNYEDGVFTEILQPASKTIKDYLAQLDITLPKGFRAEINLEATNWIKEIAGSLQKGFVLTIDYGYPSEELYCSRRNLGTLTCYHQHKINNNPYINIGKQDITAHVNFSALNHWGQKNGLQCCGYTSQKLFLHASGLSNYLRTIETSGNANYTNSTEQLLLAHTLMVDLGNKLKVLVQQKEVLQPTLSGLRFSQAFV